METANERRERTKAVINERLITSGPYVILGNNAVLRESCAVCGNSHRDAMIPA